MNELKVLGKEKVGKIEFTGIEGGFGEGKKCMLVKDIAKIHNQPVGKINERINSNKNHFREGIDVINIKSVIPQKDIEKMGFTQNALNRLKYIYLLSERGYLKLVKLLEDDKAWDIYEDLVDNYFNMRAAIESDNKAILRNKRLAIMEENTKTRQAELMYKVAMETKSPAFKNKLLKTIAERMTGETFIDPTPQQPTYSATWIGNQLGISAQEVGKIANQLELKPLDEASNEYGHWILSKSRYSDVEVNQFLYSKAGVEAIATEQKKRIEAARKHK